MHWEASRSDIADEFPEQFLSFGFASLPSRVLTVAIVDDAPTPEGESLRVELSRETTWTSDPWVHQPLVYLHATSDPGLRTPWIDDVAFLSSGENPTSGLIVSNDYSPTRPAAEDETLQRYVNDVLDSYAGLRADTVEPLRALDAAGRLLNVLNGDAPPANEHEARMLERDYSTIYLRFAITRTDESSTSVEELERRVSKWEERNSLVLGTAHYMPSEPVLDPNAALPSLFEFVKRYQDISVWPWQNYLGQHRGIVDRFPDCLPSVPLLDNGKANCRAFRLFDATSLNVSSECPESLGWHSTSSSVAQAMRDHYLGEFVEEGVPIDDELRETIAAAAVCEIRQLTGEALESCRNAVECNGCEPGWCYNDEIEHNSSCFDTGNWEGSERFRFVDGAHYGDVPSSNSVVVCEELPEQSIAD